MKKLILTFCLFLTLVLASMFAGFNITVSALDGPEFSGITQLTDNSVLIEFDSHESYDDVIIYRSTDTYNWDKITTIDWLDCYYIGEYVDKSLKANQKYYYKLTYYDSYYNEYGASSEVKSIKLSKNVFPQSDSVTVPVFKKATQIFSDKIAIEFESFEDVCIFRKTDTSDWVKIAEVGWEEDKSVYIDKNISINKSYEYKLVSREYSYSYDCYLYSFFTETKKISTVSISFPKGEDLISPKLDSISSVSATSVKLNFDCYEDSYIYRKTSNSDWKKIATVDFWDYEYVDKNLTPNTKYYYKLISFEHSYEYDCKLYSDFSNTKSYTPKVSTIKNLSAAGKFKSINLKWSKNSGVTGYKIYMSTSKNGKFSLVKTITNNKTTSYEKTGLTVNKKYYFKICGYKTISKKNYTGSLSTIVSATVKNLNRPTSVKASPLYRKVKLSWAKSKDVTGYKIYMSTSKNGKYSLVKTIINNKTTSYEKTGLTANKKYYFKICGYKTISKKNYTGPFSSVVSATTKKLGCPSKTQLQGYYKSIDVFWEPVSGADGYQIYVSTSKNGKYKCVKNITKQSSSVTIKNLKTLTNYYVKIRAYDTVSGKKAYSDFTKVLKAKTISSKASNIKRTIRVTKPEIYKINSVGGVSFEIYWRNQSSKKIKYLKFYVTPYNAVNDRMSWLGSTWCSITGPISKTKVGDFYRYKGEWDMIIKEKNTYSTLYPTYTLKKPDLKNTFNCRVWENVWYNSDIDKIKLSKIKIEYMDGTSKTISGEDIKYAIW